MYRNDRVVRQLGRSLVLNSGNSWTTSRSPAAFRLAYGAKFPKAVAKVTDDLDELLAVYDFPAEHWIHLRTTNPIESTFATVRHRTKITRGPGSRAAGLAMAFKLIEAAQGRWRAVNGPHLVALVRAGYPTDVARVLRPVLAEPVESAPEVWELDQRRRLDDGHGAYRRMAATEPLPGMSSRRTASTLPPLSHTRRAISSTTP